MTFNAKLIKNFGIVLASTSLLLAGCTNTQATATGNSNVKIDRKAANDATAAKKTAAGKEVQMYDTDRPKTEDYSKVNQNQAKYVFLFIGDGMGVTPVTAAENYLGFTKTNEGEVYPDLMNFTDRKSVV